MKILHVLSQRPDSTGSGTYLQAMVREAAAVGHESFVIAGIQSGLPGEIDCPVEYVTFDVGGDISYPIVGMSDIMPYESRRFRDLSPGEIEEYEAAFAEAIRGAVLAFDPDVIHCHHLWILTSLARRLCPSVPVVATCHGSDLRQFQTCPHLQERVLTGCRGLDAVMALSEAQRDEILSLYGLPSNKVAVVGAGYDAQMFASVEKPDADPVRVIYAGKLSAAKGVPWMLRALATIDAPAWKLDLVGGGSGEEADTCKGLAERLGDRVIIHGPLPQARLAEVMKECHLLVLPSFYEGLPLIVLEGLASGCRIVTTDLPGTTELLGYAEVDFVTLVETPRLHDLDRPYEEDEGQYQRDLAGAMRRQMESARETPRIDVSPIAERMEAYSWPGVFRRVLGVYSRVSGRKPRWSPQNPGCTAALTILLVLCITAMLGVSLLTSPLSWLTTPNRTVVHVMERDLDLAEAGSRLPGWIRWAAMGDSPEEVRRAAVKAYDEVIALEADLPGDIPVDDVIFQKQAVDGSRWVDRGLYARLLIFSVLVLLLLALGALITALWLWRSRRWATIGTGQGVAPWTAADGYGVAVRAAIVAAAMFLLFSLLPVPLLSLWMTLLTSLGLIWLMHRRLLRPWGLTFREAFGLGIPRDIIACIIVPLGVLTVAFLGQMVINAVTGVIGWEGHWSEHIVENLLFGSLGSALFLSVDVVVWAPLFEEIGFRGLVYTTLRTRMKATPAILVSSAIFAMIHFYSLAGFISVFWLGILMALVYEKTRSLWPCIILHALWNLLSVSSLLLLYR